MNAAEIEAIRAAIYEGILVRKGFLITEEIARDRAGNITTGLFPIVEDIVTAALKDAARGEVVTGSIETKGTEL